jgi:hypothetical protein
MMIGVIANAADQTVVREFFELFKTPWEFYRSDGNYDVLIAADGRSVGLTAKLVLIYSGTKTAFDSENKLQLGPRREHTTLSYKGDRIPIYGKCVTFQTEGFGSLVDEGTREPAASVTRSNGSTRIRIGFDLFREIRFLLTVGQPAVHARVPTLEMHIRLLRDLIVGCSISLVEIPPIPEGHGLIVCLTHDIDHPAIRLHKFDHTMFGFLYRAVFGSLVSVIQGKLSARQLVINWGAALMLPLIYLGLVKDFWFGFDRYLEIEKGLGSTFFVIPCKNNPGRGLNGTASSRRASRYDPSDITGHLKKLLAAGCEIGTHGIDAWVDSSKGKEELDQVSRFTGNSKVGVRMHWLYFDKCSPATLEQGGFSYDSTFGYNETVGYRAGTMQAFKHLETRALMELPLNVMDTALFYPTYLNLSPRAGKELVWGMINDAERFGGALTVNWHDRSIAPERLWGEFYLALIDELKSRDAWFPTASQTVSWFRKRRSAVFERVRCENGSLKVRASVGVTDNLPDLRIRVYEPLPGDITGAKRDVASGGFSEVVLKQSVDI